MKKKSPWKCFLLIPIQFVLSLVIIIGGGLMADAAYWAEVENAGAGHGAPVFTILSIVLGLGLFILSIIVSIIWALSRSAKNKKLKA